MVHYGITMFNLGLGMEHFISGVSGGTVSTLILHPLDLIKLRFAGNLCIHISVIYELVSCDEK